MKNDTWEKFWDIGLRTWKYGYFAPLMAAWFVLKRQGGYVFHLRALYRLTFRFR